MKSKKTIVLGIGNPILSDDGVGIRVAQEIKRKVPDAEVRELSVSGLAILDEIEGYDRLIIIDSMKTGKNPPGTLSKLKMEDLKYAMHLSSYHSVNFPTAMSLGKKFYSNIPGQIEIYAIEIRENTVFGEKCTPEIENAIGNITEQIVREQFNA
jgi:hydrogenase maturation protease